MPKTPAEIEYKQRLKSMTERSEREIKDFKDGKPVISETVAFKFDLEGFHAIMFRDIKEYAGAAQVLLDALEGDGQVILDETTRNLVFNTMAAIFRKGLMQLHSQMKRGIQLGRAIEQGRIYRVRPEDFGCGDCGSD